MKPLADLTVPTAMTAMSSTTDRTTARTAKCVLAVLAGAVLFAAQAAPVDGPELAAPGPHAVGVMKLAVDVGTLPAADGTAPVLRQIDAWLWYPSSATPGPQRDLRVDT